MNQATMTRVALTGVPQPALPLGREIVTGGGSSQPRLAPAPSRASATSPISVLHVTPGRERTMAAHVSRLIGPAAGACFVPRTAYERRRAGTWRTEYELTFPSYVFISVADEEALERGLSVMTGRAHLPRVGARPATLDPREAELLTALMDQSHVIRVSRGTLEDGRLTVEEGPLAGLEHLVTRIDRHRRVAYVSSDLSEGGLRVGLEVVSKI